MTQKNNISSAFLIPSLFNAVRAVFHSAPSWDSVSDIMPTTICPCTDAAAAAIADGAEAEPPVSWGVPFARGRFLVICRFRIGIELLFLIQCLGDKTLTILESLLEIRRARRLAAEFLVE